MLWNFNSSCIFQFIENIILVFFYNMEYGADGQIDDFRRGIFSSVVYIRGFV